MNRAGEGKGSLGDIFVSALPGAAVGILVTLLVMYISTLLIYSGRMSEELGDIIAPMAVLVGACSGTLIAAKRRGSGAPSVGLIGGGIYLFLILAISMLCGYDTMLWSQIVKTGICAIMGGLAGSALALTRGKRRKGRKTR